MHELLLLTMITLTVDDPNIEYRRLIAETLVRPWSKQSQAQDDVPRGNKNVCVYVCMCAWTCGRVFVSLLVLAEFTLTG